MNGAWLMSIGWGIYPQWVILVSFQVVCYIMLHYTYDL